VYCEEHWRAGRCSLVYHFTLERGSDIMVMPVIANPYVWRFIAEAALQVVPFEERARVRQPRRNPNA
jgi:hypothetical protein